MMNKEELEKEALAKYKTGSYPQLHPDHFAFIHGYLAGAGPREKRIIRLMASLSDVSTKSVLRIVKLEKQLAKAKDLLAKWVELYKPKVGNIPLTPIQIDTEQFLKELES